MQTIFITELTLTNTEHEHEWFQVEEDMIAFREWTSWWKVYRMRWIADDVDESVNVMGNTLHDFNSLFLVVTSLWSNILFAVVESCGTVNR